MVNEWQQLLGDISYYEYFFVIFLVFIIGRQGKTSVWKFQRSNLDNQLEWDIFQVAWSAELG